MLAKFGDDAELGEVLVGEFWSGVWVGPMSVRLESLAVGLDGVATASGHASVRRWAADSARSLREWAASERKREDEESIGR